MGWGDTHQEESPEKVSGSPFGLRGLTTYRGKGITKGCREKTSWDCRRLIMGCLGGAPKVGKGRDQGGLARNRHGREKESEKEDKKG